MINNYELFQQEKEFNQQLDLELLNFINQDFNTQKLQFLNLVLIQNNLTQINFQIYQIKQQIPQIPLDLVSKILKADQNYLDEILNIVMVIIQDVQIQQYILKNKQFNYIMDKIKMYIKKGEYQKQIQKLLYITYLYTFNQKASNYIIQKNWQLYFKQLLNNHSLIKETLFIFMNFEHEFHFDVQVDQIYLVGMLKVENQNIINYCLTKQGEPELLYLIYNLDVKNTEVQQKILNLYQNDQSKNIQIMLNYIKQQDDIKPQIENLTLIKLYLQTNIKQIDLKFLAEIQNYYCCNLEIQLLISQQYQKGSYQVNDLLIKSLLTQFILYGSHIVIQESVINQINQIVQSHQKLLIKHIKSFGEVILINAKQYLNTVINEKQKNQVLKFYALLLYITDNKDETCQQQFEQVIENQQILKLIT